MSIIRSNKSTGNYFLASKHYVEDNDLSWKAKGLMSYLFSKPDDWEIYQSQLTKVSTDGKASVRSIINELLEHGYMTRESRRKDNGDFNGYNYTLHEKPRVRKMGDAKMGDAKMVFAKSDTTNNNSTNNDLTNNDGNILSGNPTMHQPHYKPIIDYLNQKTGKNFKHTTNKTQIVIKARWNEGFEEDDFRRVIDNKVSEWKGTDMEKYLRPETLFGTKFEGYLNQGLQPSGMDQLERMKYDESYWD